MPSRVRSIAVVAIPLLLAHGAAWGVWSDGASASAQYTTGLLAPPTDPATAPGVCIVASSDQIVVSWTATTSTWADGYEIARSINPGGPYSVIGFVGPSASSFIDGPLPFATSYSYVVRATRNSWRSADTAAVTRTTRSALCL